MTSGDEIISGLSENEYSYEENEKKSKRRIKKASNKDTSLGKRKREDNTDQFISEDQDDNDNSMHVNTDSGNHTSTSLAKQKRRRIRRRKRNHESEDNVIEDYFDSQAFSDDEDENENEYSDDFEINQQQRDDYLQHLYGSHRSTNNDFFKKIQSEDPESIAMLYEETTVNCCL